MIKIRQGVFETNSSSCHALCIKKEALEESKLPTLDGIIQSKFMKCDETDEDLWFDSQKDKLSYVLTRLWYSEIFFDFDEFEESYLYNQFKRALLEYTSAKDLKILMSEPQLNHQTLDQDILNLWDTDELINFIFCPYIQLHTFHD